MKIQRHHIILAGAFFAIGYGILQGIAEALDATATVLLTR